MECLSAPGDVALSKGHLEPQAESKLLADVLDMHRYGPLGDYQPLCDLAELGYSYDRGK
jgi:hypothetical protein